MLHTVAKLHYESDMSQVQIAKQLGLSTATISRLLQKARAEAQDQRRAPTQSFFPQFPTRQAPASSQRDNTYTSN